MKQAISRPVSGLVLVALFVAITAAAIASSGMITGHVGGGAATVPPKLTAMVSASGRVALTDRNGRTVTRLRRGWYTLVVRVESSRADFHVSGPGLHRTTLAHFTGEALWGIRLVKGTYRYYSDHSVRATMHLVSVY
jgi:hypothetical protein